MRSVNLLSVTAFLLSLGSTLVAAEVLSSTMVVPTDMTSEFTFSTPASVFAGKNHGGRKKLRRNRRATATNVKHAATKTSELPKEDKNFWNRWLDEDMSMNTRAPTRAPVQGPTGSTPTAPAPTPTAPAPTPDTPGVCPTEIEVDCVAVDGSEKCTDIEAPASGSGDDCNVEVEYSYSMTNTGDSTQRIYSLSITRDGDTNDITSTFPVTDLVPGESAIILQNDIINVCSGGDNAFATEAAFTTGPPADVQITIACESEDGDECRALPQAQDPDECLIDIEYTYTVTNSGLVDANIILFTRTRNGEFEDLIGLLDSTFLALGDSTEVSESEEIDRCVQQSFATNTIVAQVPNAELLCDDVGFYP